MSQTARFRQVLATEGLAGLLARLLRRVGRLRSHLFPSTPPGPDSLTRAAFAQLTAEFQARTAGSTFPGLEHFYWYHTIDLGQGLITPGDYDYRAALPAWGMPADLRGQRVLDIGSATGFFAFELEKRGAEVVSVELPSLADWDMLHSERQEILAALQTFHHVATLEEAQFRHLDGPFEFCHAQLGSRVARCHSTVYDLTLARLGGTAFDWVLLGDVLLHLFSPLKALETLAPLCRGTLVISTDLVTTVGPAPVLLFLGNTSKTVDGRTWWGFTRTGLEEMLHRVGFTHIQQVGQHDGWNRRTWTRYERQVFHARKG